MMQVNLFAGSESTPCNSLGVESAPIISSPGFTTSIVTGSSMALTGTTSMIVTNNHHHNDAMKTHVLGSMDLDTPGHVLGGGSGDILSLNRKPMVTNNNETMFTKDIFTIAQGPNKPSINPIGRRLIFSQHFESILSAAKDNCIQKEFIDVYLQCEDGTLAAHALILSIASPFLKRLLEAELLGREATRMHEPPVIVLPDVRVNMMQCLLELLYTGQVMTPETQFYSLMKLIYDLEINASIDAEKTSAQPPKFQLTPVLKNISTNECEACNRPRKRSRQDTFESTFNTFFDPSQNMFISRRNSGSLSGGSSMPWRSTPGGLAVNSLTASGVEVKQEPEEKPSVEESEMKRSLLKTSINALGGTVNSLSTNSVNNNQLSHFVAVNSGYQVKLEMTGSRQSCDSMISPGPGQQDNNKESSNSDDPLAAIMNQTIFEGEGLNMYIQVPGSGATPTFVSTTTSKLGDIKQIQNQQQTQQHNSPQKKNSPAKNTHTTTTSSGEELTCSTHGDGEGGEGSSLNCDSCSRVMKGKMNLQAHKFQEHHVNPELETAAIPTNKFPCRVCCKLFTRNSDVKAHILRVHCGDRRYPCTLCGKRFKESTHLRKHLYTHTGERPHFCVPCNKGFQTSSDLKRHKKTRVHQERVDQAEAANKTAAPTTPILEKVQSIESSNLDFDRWNEQDEDLESTLTGGGTSQSSGSVSGVSANSRNSPFTVIQSIDSLQPRTSPPIGIISSSAHNPIEMISLSNSMPIFTTTSSMAPTTEYIQMPSNQQRGITTANLLLQQHQHPISPSQLQHIQFINEPLQLSNNKPLTSWSQSSGGIILNQGSDSNVTSIISSQDIIGVSGLTSSSSMSEVLSSMPSQSMGVQNLTLPSTTLDLSDIKWGILDPTSVVSSIKRSGSMDEAHVLAERIHIREDI